MEESEEKVHFWLKIILKEIVQWKHRRKKWRLVSGSRSSFLKKSTAWKQKKKKHCSSKFLYDVKEVSLLPQGVLRRMRQERNCDLNYIVYWWFNALCFPSCRSQLSRWVVVCLGLPGTFIGKEIKDRLFPVLLWLISFLAHGSRALF